MMPIGSIHGIVESIFNNKTVWAPSEWPIMITNGRSDLTGCVSNVFLTGC